MTLLKWALVFLGFTDVSIVSADIARTLFYIFLGDFLRAAGFRIDPKTGRRGSR
jgi:hypothetical protein